MKNKKSPKVNLERRKGLFIQIGLIVALSIILVAFEWSSPAKDLSGIATVSEIQFEDEMMQITRREEPKPDPKPETPPVAEVLDIVDDDIEIDDDFDFDMEVDNNTEYDFFVSDDEGEEIMEEVHRDLIAREEVVKKLGYNPYRNGEFAISRP